MGDPSLTKPNHQLEESWIFFSHRKPREVKGKADTIGDVSVPGTPSKTRRKQVQVISPRACGAFFSARTTPQPSQNPRGTLVDLG